MIAKMIAKILFNPLNFGPFRRRRFARKILLHAKREGKIPRIMAACALGSQRNLREVCGFDLHAARKFVETAFADGGEGEII